MNLNLSSRVNNGSKERQREKMENHKFKIKKLIIEQDRVKDNGRKCKQAKEGGRCSVVKRKRSQSRRTL